MHIEFNENGNKNSLNKKKPKTPSMQIILLTANVLSHVLNCSWYFVFIITRSVYILASIS